MGHHFCLGKLEIEGAEWLALFKPCLVLEGHQHEVAVLAGIRKPTDYLEMRTKIIMKQIRKGASERLC